MDNSHQSAFCLTAQHVDCPVFAARQVRPLPSAIAGSPPSNQRARKVLAFALVPLALVIMALLGTWLERNVLAAGRVSILTPSGLTSGQSSFSGIGSTPQNTLTPLQPAGLAGTPNGTSSPVFTGDCPLPNGWAPYTFQSDDSLFRLSVTHRTSIQALQEANCMGSQTLIEPGSVIFIPQLPTSTPTVTLTATRRIVPVQPTVPNQPPEDTIPQPTPIPNTPAPIATEVPPTSVPPTQVVPPTSAPPTQAPPPTVAPPLDTPTIAPATIFDPPLPTDPAPEPTLAPQPTEPLPIPTVAGNDPQP